MPAERNFLDRILKGAGARKREAQFKRKEPNNRLGHSEIRISRLRSNLGATGEADPRFRQLTGTGFTAAVRTAEGRSKLIRNFDPSAEETIFFPRLQGG